MLSPQELQRRNELALRRAELQKLHPISYNELERVVRKWLLVNDPGIIKLIPAILIANILPRKPIWLFLIGPSGGGKTEFLNAVTDLDIVYPLSLLTPTTFLSGMPGKGDTSLLPQINKKILIFKDWTNILSQQRDAKNEIMGQLRDIYDGHVKKAFGTGKIAEWGPGCKIGIIAATTPAVDLQQQMNATLGERFIHYRIAMPDRKEVARRALSNNNQHEQMEKELRNAYYSFMLGVKIPDEIPEIPDNVQKEIVSLANFTTMARSGVIRDFGYKKEVIFVPASEMPTRISQQLNTLAVSLIITNKGEFVEEDMSIIYKIALDSIPQTNRMVMKEMARGDRQTTKDIATALGYPTGPIKMYLENLALLGVCRRLKASETEEGGTSDRWVLDEEFTAILKKYEDIKEIDQSAIDNEVEEEEELEKKFSAF